MGKKNLVLYVFDNLAGTVDASAFISVHLKDLVGSFQSEGRPLDELFEHMTAEDFAGKYDEIVLLVPENYDPIRVFLGTEDVFRRAAHLVQWQMEPDDVVLSAPLSALTFEQMRELGASATAVAKATERLTVKQAMTLLSADGEAAEAIGAKCPDLDLQTKIKYGIQPNAIIKQAMKEKPDDARRNINAMFWGGLTAEALLEAEIGALDVNRPERQYIFKWYKDIFRDLVKHAGDKEGLTYELMDLVYRSYYYGDGDDDYEDDDADLDEIDGAFLDMMRLCVKYGLISIEEAIDYLYDIHMTGIVDSVLHDKKHVRDMLTF